MLIMHSYPSENFFLNNLMFKHLTAGNLADYNERAMRAKFLNTFALNMLSNH